jgi:hypothetical protein
MQGMRGSTTVSLLICNTRGEGSRSARGSGAAFQDALKVGLSLAEPHQVSAPTVAALGDLYLGSVKAAAVCPIATSWW